MVKKLKQIIINSFTLGIVEIMVHLYG